MMRGGVATAVDVELTFIRFAVMIGLLVGVIDCCRFKPVRRYRLLSSSDDASDSSDDDDDEASDDDGDEEDVSPPP